MLGFAEQSSLNRACQRPQHGYRADMSDHTPKDRRPDGVDDATVEALGRLSEALEATEVARGFLYSFHRLIGTADRTLGEAISLFRDAGHDDLARLLEVELLGRNVIAGRWTFQIVEEYDADYYRAFQRLETDARERLANGRRHVYEAEMKEREQTAGG
jgi:hypothetical protein